jgi:hypothetical protein
MIHDLKLSRLEDNKLYALGLYQYVAGIYGLIKTLLYFAQDGANTWAVNLLIIFGISLFLFSFYCGHLLIQRRYIEGLKLSTYCLIIQVINIAAAGYSFSFSSGFFVNFYLDLTNDFLLGLSMNFSEFEASLSTSSQSRFLSINLVAVYILIFIEKVKESITEKTSVADTPQI